MHPAVQSFVSLRLDQSILLSELTYSAAMKETFWTVPGLSIADGSTVQFRGKGKQKYSQPISVHILVAGERRRRPQGRFCWTAQSGLVTVRELRKWFRAWRARALPSSSAPGSLSPLVS
jgi:hypothetical protein